MKLNDWVRLRSGGSAGQVYQLSQDGKLAYVRWSKTRVSVERVEELVNA